MIDDASISPGDYFRELGRKGGKASVESRRAKKVGKALTKREKATPNISAEERQRRRDVANRLVEEGRFGGAKFGKLGGGQRKPHLSTLVANAIEVADVLLALSDALAQDQPAYIRVRAAEVALKFEEKAVMLALAQGEDARAERGDLLRDEERSLAIVRRAEEILRERRDGALDGEAVEET